MFAGSLWDEECQTYILISTTLRATSSDWRFQNKYKYFKEQVFDASVYGNPKIYYSGKIHTNFVSSLHKEIKLRNAELRTFKKNTDKDIFYLF